MNNIERAIEIIEDEHDPNFGPIDAPSLIYALNGAGLLMPDEDELDTDIREFYPPITADVIDRLRIAREEHNDG